jgi:hypothetical protein
MEDMKRRLIRGTPRINSMYKIHRALTPCIFDRRPSARITPKGYAAVTPKTARRRVRGKPPHWVLSTEDSPNMPPFMRRPIVKSPMIQA